MKTLHWSLCVVLTFFILPFICAQNIGIGVPNPSEKLEVDGIVFSSSGGIMFPDSTLQVSAAANNSFEAEAEPRQYILMEIEGPNGDINGSDSAAGIVNATKVLNFEFEHSANGGPAQMNGLKLEKEINKASVPIMSVFHSGQVLTVVKGLLLVL